MENRKYFPFIDTREILVSIFVINLSCCLFAPSIFPFYLKDLSVYRPFVFVYKWNVFSTLNTIHTSIIKLCALYVVLASYFQNENDQYNMKAYKKNFSSEVGCSIMIIIAVLSGILKWPLLDWVWVYNNKWIEKNIRKRKNTSLGFFCKGL